MGLANTRERLRLIYGDRQHVDVTNREPRGADVHLRLPFATGARVASTVHLRAVPFPYDPQHQVFVNVYRDGAMIERMTPTGPGRAATAPSVERTGRDLRYMPWARR